MNTAKQSTGYLLLLVSLGLSIMPLKAYPQTRKTSTSSQLKKQKEPIIIPREEISNHVRAVQFSGVHNDRTLVPFMLDVAKGNIIADPRMGPSRLLNTCEHVLSQLNVKEYLDILDAREIAWKKPQPAYALTRARIISSYETNNGKDRLASFLNRCQVTPEQINIAVKKHREKVEEEDKNYAAEGRFAPPILPETNVTIAMILVDMIFTDRNAQLYQATKAAGIDLCPDRFNTLKLDIALDPEPIRIQKILKELIKKRNPLENVLSSMLELQFDKYLIAKIANEMITNEIIENERLSKDERESTDHKILTLLDHSLNLELYKKIPK